MQPAPAKKNLRALNGDETKLLVRQVIKIIEKLKDGTIKVVLSLLSQITGLIDLAARFVSRTVDHLLVGSLELFNKKSPVLIHIPVLRAWGDAAEEVNFGILKARREGKKILFPCPHALSSTFPISVANRELIRIDSDYCWLSSDSFWRYLVDSIFTAVLATLRILYLVWRFNLRILRFRRPSYVPPAIRTERAPQVRKAYPEFYVGRTTLWKPDQVDYFSWDVVRAFNWKQQLQQPVFVGLSPKKQRKAEQMRLDMGIPLDDWFVSLHVREGHYEGRFSEKAQFYDASIQNYLEAIRVITSAGGWVVRLGDSTMTPLPPMERVVDYPFTPQKSNLMDIYLIRECRTFMGMASGPLEVSRIFQNSEIMVNLAEWSTAFPLRKGSLAILKHYFSRSRNRFLSVKEILEEPMFECQALSQFGDDYILVENTPNEILDVVEEYLSQPTEHPHSDLQKEFNYQRTLQIHRGLALEIPPTIPEVIQKYRYAARIESMEGTIGQKYLEQNWLTDSYNGYKPD